MELEVLERITLYRATFGPLVHVDKRWVWGSPRAPLLHKSLKVEPVPGKGEFPRSITNRLKRDDIGVVDSRHGWIGIEVEEGKRGSGYW
jgi:hypothetical protein